MIKFKHRGSFKNIEAFFKRSKDFKYDELLHKCGETGVAALAANTPIGSGLTADSWDYEIEKSSSGAVVRWLNTNENNGVNIALILQYGHGTGTGGYVEGIDYINPALKPVFDAMADQLWKEVIK